MQAAFVFKALSSSSNLAIVTLLSDHDMTATEIFSELGDRAPEYRQSVNKALEVLRQAGLVKKYYGENKNRLLYSLIYKGITINFGKMSIE